MLLASWWSLAPSILDSRYLVTASLSPLVSPSPSPRTPELTDNSTHNTACVTIVNIIIAVMF